MFRKAFTLVELLVVIAILSLLVSILVPALSRAHALARQTACAANLSATAKAYHAYAANNDDWICPSINNDYHPTPRQTAIAATVRSTPGKPRYRNAAILYEHGYVETPQLFYCPAATCPWYVYDSYVFDRTSGHPKAVQWGTHCPFTDYPLQKLVLMGYVYNGWGRTIEFSNGNFGPELVYRKLSSMPSDKALAVDNFLYAWTAAVHTANGMDRPAFNIAYSDGHVEGHASSAVMISLVGQQGAYIDLFWDIDYCSSGCDFDDWNDLYEMINQGI
jgi:prepilin-type N-terminal cleavage/methylation domain-containing protein/prepilin-type processing-associated H-X9-DG protein